MIKFQIRINHWLSKKQFFIFMEIKMVVISNVIKKFSRLILLTILSVNIPYKLIQSMTASSSSSSSAQAQRPVIQGIPAQSIQRFVNKRDLGYFNSSIAFGMHTEYKAFEQTFTYNNPEDQRQQGQERYLIILSNHTIDENFAKAQSQCLDVQQKQNHAAQGTSASTSSSSSSSSTTELEPIQKQIQEQAKAFNDWATYLAIEKNTTVHLITYIPYPNNAKTLSWKDYYIKQGQFLAENILKNKPNLTICTFGRCANIIWPALQHRVMQKVKVDTIITVLPTMTLTPDLQNPHFTRLYNFYSEAEKLSQSEVDVSSLLHFQATTSRKYTQMKPCENDFENFITRKQRLFPVVNLRTSILYNTNFKAIKQATTPEMLSYLFISQIPRLIKCADEKFTLNFDLDATIFSQHTIFSHLLLDLRESRYIDDWFDQNCLHPEITIKQGKDSTLRRVVVNAMEGKIEYKHKEEKFCFPVPQKYLDNPKNLISQANTEEEASTYAQILNQPLKTTASSSSSSDQILATNYAFDPEVTDLVNQLKAKMLSDITLTPAAKTCPDLNLIEIVNKICKQKHVYEKIAAAKYQYALQFNLRCKYLDKTPVKFDAQCYLNAPLTPYAKQLIAQILEEIYQTREIFFLFKPQGLYLDQDEKQLISLASNYMSELIKKYFGQDIHKYQFLSSPYTTASSSSSISACASTQCLIKLESMILKDGKFTPNHRIDYSIKDLLSISSSRYQFVIKLFAQQLFVKFIKPILPEQRDHLLVPMEVIRHYVVKFFTPEELNDILEYAIRPVEVEIDFVFTTNIATLFFRTKDLESIARFYLSKFYDNHKNDFVFITANDLNKMLTILAEKIHSDLSLYSHGYPIEALHVSRLNGYTGHLIAKNDCILKTNNKETIVYIQNTLNTEIAKLTAEFRAQKIKGDKDLTRIDALIKRPGKQTATLELLTSSQLQKLQTIQRDYDVLTEWFAHIPQNTSSHVSAPIAIIKWGPLCAPKASSSSAPASPSTPSPAAEEKEQSDTEASPRSDTPSSHSELSSVVLKPEATPSPSASPTSTRTETSPQTVIAETTPSPEASPSPTNTTPETRKSAEEESEGN